MVQITRYNPFQEIEKVLNRFYGSKLSDGDAMDFREKELTLPDWSPKVDVKETKDAYLIKAELPGISKDAIDISLEKGVLTIRGEKQFEKTTEDEKHHRVECSYGSFVRSFSLPEEVDENKVKALFKDGVLNLSISKAPGKTKKTINIAAE